jgi:hypothetical protein
MTVGITRLFCCYRFNIQIRSAVLQPLQGHCLCVRQPAQLF